MRPSPPLVLAALVAATSLLASDVAEASCFCMLRSPPVTTTTDVTRDPSYNPGTAVFLLRDGTKTVLTIEAAYEGPVTDLSVVIPVPTRIEREQVRTVNGSLFRTLDRATAPRVTHVWPGCRMRRRRPAAGRTSGLGDGMATARGGLSAGPEDLGVTVEDEWAVDEYDISLLSADQSTGLLTFLNQRGLELPPRAATALRAYIETGHRFVLARVDPTRAQRVGDTMVLSPIQLEYQSEELVVPVRLGTFNSPGEQELILYIASRDGRYRVANRSEVTAPTDLRLDQSARGSVAELYDGLMAETFRQHPGAAVTEYAQRLGRHVGAWRIADLGFENEDAGMRMRAGRTRGGPSGVSNADWTLTRIRHRYGADMHDDLRLAPAPPLRLTRRWRPPELQDRTRADRSNFLVRFIVEHGSSTCPSRAGQRWNAHRFATADSMWSEHETVWPGSLLLDRVPSLGIEPGSSAPANWPPPPPPPPAETSAVAALAPGVVAPGAIDARTLLAIQNKPTPAAAPDAGLCAVGHRPGSLAWLGVLAPLALLWARRRRRAS